MKGDARLKSEVLTGSLPFAKTISQQSEMKEYLDITIAQKIEEIAKRFPDRTAVSAPGRLLSYRELNELSDSTAQAFLSRGIRKGSHIALFSANEPELIIIALALWKIGAVLIPLCTAYAEGEQLSALKKSDAEQLILIGKPVNGVFSVPKHELWSMGIKTLRFTEPEDLIDFIASKDKLSVAVDTAEDDNLYYENDYVSDLEQAKALVSPDDTDMILFTSGSTSGAKPVASTHKARINLAMTHADFLEATEKDVFCAVLPLYHCFAITGVMLAALSRGAELAFPKDRHSANTLRCIEARHCTILSAVPTLYSALMAKQKEAAADISSLRTGMIGGSPYSSELFKRICRELGMTLLPSIGMTEATAGYTSGRLTDDPELRATSLGELFPEVECRIADDSGNELPIGTTGRILIKGPSIIGRYYNDYAPPCMNENGWMDTGDMGYLDKEGHLFFKGRRKEIIIRAGENISPVEIENALSDLPGIRELKAVGVPDPHRIEEICLCVVMQTLPPDSSEEERNTAREELRQTLDKAAGERLSNYMQPRYIVFMDSFPRKDTGKIDLNQLKEAAAKLCATEKE
ncbi:MAG: acyl--CoA ligase [Firmicutes bacterium]|nr:acyl--CoA ligase [Bacillota bacterium]